MTTVPARFVFDSSAWIEYLRGTPAGKTVAAILENEKSVVLTPNIVAAEVVSKMTREHGPVAESIESISNQSIAPLETRHDYFLIGQLHAELRKTMKNVSLADAVILTLAEKNSARIVTTDQHLKGKNTVFIG